eukprot:TRINITY_DN12099_c0_g5_i1.p1 TRINITY_DN12099_c0_g5~~TRINITY_DN12099_c0_g5_i1.p1  ORF type:complete len:141 (+),score=11.24 TRINITY_DN12099_c0_g5_i1:2-424(+)
MLFEGEQLTEGMSLMELGIEGSAEISVVVRASPPGAVFEVRGAGHARSNGFYKQFGEYNGRPDYFTVDDDGLKNEASNIFWREEDTSCWGIHGIGSDPADVAYVSFSASPFHAPPVTGWECRLAPGPTPVVTYIAECQDG